jgi:dephospho-CoA kinase
MSIVAVTGSLCSGKSVVCNILRSKGAILFDADEIIHSYYKDKKSAAYRKIKTVFPQCLDRKNRISRIKLAKIVFSNNNDRRKLEKIVHPLIINDLKEWVKAKKDKGGIFVAEVPLLFEKKLDIIFDRVILVYAPKSILFQRIKRKFGISKKEALGRLRLFSSWRKKKENVEFFINNVSDIAELKRKVGLIWQDLKRG